MDEAAMEFLRAAGLPPTTRPLPPAPAGECLPPEPPAPDLGEGALLLALIATRNYVPFARLTARSFLAHHPGVRAVLLLTDGQEADRALFPEGRVVLLDQLDLPQAGWYAARFTASELANALKPVFLRYLAPLAERVIYLDSDIAVFDRFDEMLDALQQSDLVLVPHMLRPLPRPEQFDVHPNRTDIFNSGLINAGAFGIAPGRLGEFLEFWERANFDVGSFYAQAGNQTDQQYLNWALVMVPGAAIIREPRYNVAYWNLHDRDLRLRPGSSASAFDVGDRPLAFFHFSGYDIDDPLRVSVHDGRYNVYHAPALATILAWYSARLHESEDVMLLHEPYRFDVLGNGVPLNRFLRDTLKKYEVFLPRFDTRTQAGADALCGVLMDPLAATGSLLPLLASEIYDRRRDLQHSFPAAATELHPAGFLEWFQRHAGEEFGIQPLVDRFRRVLAAPCTLDLARAIAAALEGRGGRFLGEDRMQAAALLFERGLIELGDALLGGRQEWPVESDLGAVLDIWLRRPDLQRHYPRPLEEDLAGYCEWVVRHGPEEYAIAPECGARLVGHTADAVLARVFSLLARREDLFIGVGDSLLLDDPGPVLRALIRLAGDGLELGLDDVLVLRFLHLTRRELLVPVWLEMPLVRARAGASRRAEASPALLPAGVRACEWAAAGCRLHAAAFDRFHSVLDEEMRAWGTGLAGSPRDVHSLLRAERRTEPALRSLDRPFRAALRRIGDPAVAARETRRLAERRARPGVNIFGYFRSDIGIGESSRGLAAAVARLRPVNAIPTTTAQMREGTGLADLFERFDYLTDTIIHVGYPHMHEDPLGRMRPEQVAGRRAIAHLAWEQAEAHPMWKSVYDRYDEIWTISDFAATGLRALFPGRVRVVPNVLDFASFPEVAPRACGTGEQVTFAYVFDANSSMERKNPEGVIEAFTRAFRGTAHARRARLVLKVAGLHRPEHATRVERLRRLAAASGLAIVFDQRHFDRAGMLRFIAGCDCYVSLHRAEGFGYTMAEAMAYGVPVIASGFSGNLDYMDERTSFLVPCREAFVRNAEGPFQRGSVWGEPDLDAAASLMRAVMEHPDRSETVGARGQAAVIARLSAQAVAELIRPALGLAPPVAAAAPEPVAEATLAQAAGRGRGGVVPLGAVPPARRSR